MNTTQTTTARLVREFPHVVDIEIADHIIRVTKERTAVTDGHLILDSQGTDSWRAMLDNWAYDGLHDVAKHGDYFVFRGTWA